MTRSASAKAAISPGSGPRRRSSTPASRGRISFPPIRASGSRPRDPAAEVAADRVVIVGGSLAGASAARSLRRQGFYGEVLLIGQEIHPPYSRPALSKQFLLDSGKGADSLYQPLGDELAVRALAGRTATGLDPREREVMLDDGERIRFDGLVVATGAVPRRPPRHWDAGAGLAGVHVLRTVDDAAALRAELVAA